MDKNCCLLYKKKFKYVTGGPNVCESPTEFNGVQLKYALTSLDCTPSTSTILPVRMSSAIEVKLKVHITLLYLSRCGDHILTF